MGTLLKFQSKKLGNEKQVIASVKTKHGNVHIDFTSEHVVVSSKVAFELAMMLLNAVKVTTKDIA